MATGFGVNPPGFGLDPFGDPQGLHFVIGSGAAVPYLSIVGSAVPVASVGSGKVTPKLSVSGQSQTVLGVTGKSVPYLSAGGGVITADGGTLLPTPTGSGGGGSSPTEMINPDSTQTISMSGAISFFNTTNTVIEAVAGTGIILTLPDATMYPGQTIKITKSDSSLGTVEIVTVLSQTINGAASYILTNQWQSVYLEAIGGNWVANSFN